MADPYIKEFETRLRRIYKIRRKGGAFEAPGTLGQSYYTRRARGRGKPVIKYALIILAALVLFKSVTYTHLGSAEYLARVENLQAGSMFEQMGATLMAPDPLTLKLAHWLNPVLS